jgi:hypothetical protein
VEADADSATVPVKPFGAVTVIAEDPEVPAKIWAGDTADAERLRQSQEVMKTLTECEILPLVPVIVSVNAPAVAELQDTEAVCGDTPNMTLAGKVQISPAGDEETERLTVPVKPFTALSVTVTVHEPPGTICAGLHPPAAIVKSTTWNRIGDVVWDRAPLVPVTVTV